MGRLTRPHDLLLHFGEAFEADLDGQIAASDHHADRPAAHRGQQQLGKVLERDHALDLQHDAQISRVEPQEFLLEPVDVCGALHERQVDHVGVVRNEREVVEVFRGQRAEVKIGVGEIDSLGCLEFCSSRTDVGDGHGDLGV